MVIAMLLLLKLRFTCQPYMFRCAGNVRGHANSEPLLGLRYIFLRQPREPLRYERSQHSGSAGRLLTAATALRIQRLI